MSTILAQTTLVLGVLSGYVCAKLITDETGWYKKQFFIATSSIAVLTPFALILSPGPYSLALSMCAAFVFAGILILALNARAVHLLALSAGGLAIISGVGGWQLIFILLMPATGYLYSAVEHKQFWWFLLMPTIIILFTLLS